jgi:hypothetical protein
LKWTLYKSKLVVWVTAIRIYAGGEGHKNKRSGFYAGDEGCRKTRGAIFYLTYLNKVGISYFYQLGCFDCIKQAIQCTGYPFYYIPGKAEYSEHLFV